MRIIMALLLVGFSASAFENNGAWVKSDFLKATIFRSTISDAVFEPVERGLENRVSPAQHISEPATGDFTQQSTRLAAKILNAVAVDLTDANTRNLNDPKSKDIWKSHHQRFAAGVKGDLQGRVFTYESGSDPGKYITCVAIVRDHQKVQAVYLKTYKDVLPGCASELIGLTRSKVMYQ